MRRTRKRYLKRGERKEDMGYKSERFNDGREKKYMEDVRRERE